VDSILFDETADLVSLLGTPGLQALMEAEAADRNPKDALFIEIRDRSGVLVARSANLPEGGLGPFRDHGVEPRTWERSHPDSQRGHRRIRVLDRIVDGHQVRVAKALTRQQKRYGSFRDDLLRSLVLMALLGAALAWWVADRLLRPLRGLTRRAQELADGASGNLPRTATGDELDRLASTLNDFLRQIHEQVSRVRRMTADAGHALRTPLTAVRGNLELWLQRDPENAPDEVPRVLKQLDRIERTVNDLLTLERLDARKGGAVGDRIDLADLAGSLAVDFRLVAAEQAVDLILSAESAEIRAERNELLEAVANLIDNAIRHSPTGGEVRLTVGVESGRARLTVVDTGPGIREEDADRIFERFHSQGSSGTGTGLGLAIARSVARAHGGDVWAEAAVEGTLFVLDLPLASSESGGIPERACERLELPDRLGRSRVAGRVA